MKNKDKTQVTESISSRYKDLDLWPSNKILSHFIEDQVKAVNALNDIIEDIEKAAIDVCEYLSKDNRSRLIYIGSGTSGRICVQDGAELYPTYGWPPDRLSFLIAGGNQALYRPIEGAEDDITAAQHDVSQLTLSSNDIIIAVSASGSTPYTVECCKVARNIGCLVIGVSSNLNSDLFSYTTHSLYTNSGPEPIAGSTRMNAGTAQKVCLNLLSTLIMIRMGCVYDGMMVDFQQMNSKLKKRACTVLQHITQCNHEEALKTLEEFDGNIKLSALVLKGLNKERALDLLQENNNNLRVALSHLDSQ
jgi:N-acetylmuramic acid 6-phosphate etherase